MKKLAANLCIWILGKLGYENNYSQKTTIEIKVNAEQAIKELKKLNHQVDEILDKMPQLTVSGKELLDMIK